MIWLLLGAGPLFFLLAIIAASILASAIGVAPNDIPRRVARWMPQVLLVVQVLLLLALILTSATWRSIVLAGATGQGIGTALAIGALTGAAIAWLYLGPLGDLLSYCQRRFGDYVPPGELLPTLSSSVRVFFVANVVLAPVVEEVLYRGYAIPALAERMGLPGAALVSCAFFGILHWPGGVWYMVASGLVAGGAFAGLFLWQGLAAALAAHVVLNALEFAVGWRRQRSSR